MTLGDGYDGRASGRRRAILDAALVCFNEKGLAATSIEDIRLRSGASVGSIYHHFGNKEGIANALYDAGLAAYHDGLRPVFAADVGAEDLIRRVVGWHIQWSVANRELTRFLMTARRAPELMAGEVERRRETGRFLREGLAALERHAAAGRLRAFPVDLLLGLLVGPAQEYLRAWLAGHARTPPDVAAERLAEAAWAALRP